MTPRLKNGRFVPGISGNPRGRPRSNLEVREIAGQLVRSRAYLDAVERRLLAGKLAPAVEVALWHYAHGKPVERLRLEDGNAVPPFVVRDWGGKLLSVAVMGTGCFERVVGDGDTAALFAFTPAGQPAVNPPRPADGDDDGDRAA